MVFMLCSKRNVSAISNQSVSVTVKWDPAIKKMRENKQNVTTNSNHAINELSTINRVCEYKVSDESLSLIYAPRRAEI